MARACAGADPHTGAEGAVEPGVDASERNRAFLRYVVDETLTGRAHLIKGYSIAQSVFKRGVEFDPQLEPVVRIEASRLRRCLERYYLRVGQSDPIRIDIPKGGYVPVFEMVGPAAAAVADPAFPPLRSSPVALPAIASAPTIAIIPFRNLDPDLNYASCARGITEELFAPLMHFCNLRVLAPNPRAEPASLSDIGQGGAEACTYVVLQGSVRSIAHGVRIAAQLLDPADGTYVWATSFNREVNGEALVEIETEVAETIAAMLEAPYGVIARFSAQQLRRNLTPNPGPYKSLMRWYLYRRSPTQALHDEVRDDLLKAVEAAPDDVECWARLVYIYLDEWRFGFTGRQDRDALPDLAMTAARHAVELDEHSAFAHLALSLVHFHLHELDRAAHEGRRALELNPYNPDVVAQVGWRLAVPGNWEVGMPLFRRGMALDPDPPNWYRLVLALDAYRRGDGAAALSEVRNGAVVRIPIAYVIASAILAEFGYPDEAVAIARSGGAMFAELSDDPETQLRLFNVDPALVRRLSSSLRAIAEAPDQQGLPGRHRV